LTRDGYVQIQDVVGKEVMVWNGEFWAEVTPFSTDIQDTVVVHLSDGTSLRCTHAHEWVTWEGWERDGVEVRKKAHALLPGDKLRKFEMPVVEDGISYGDNDQAYSQGFYAGDGSEGWEQSWVYPPKYCCINRLVGTVSPRPPSIDRRSWRHGPM